jgi:hypothetical protein
MITKYLTLLGLVWVAYQLGKRTKPNVIIIQTAPNVIIIQTAVGDGNYQNLSL